MNRCDEHGCDNLGVNDWTEHFLIGQLQNHTLRREDKLSRSRNLTGPFRSADE